MSRPEIALATRLPQFRSPLELHQNKLAIQGAQQGIKQNALALRQGENALARQDFELAQARQQATQQTAQAQTDAHKDAALRLAAALRGLPDEASRRQSQPQLQAMLAQSGVDLSRFPGPDGLSDADLDAYIRVMGGAPPERAGFTTVNENARLVNDQTGEVVLDAVQAPSKIGEYVAEGGRQMVIMQAPDGSVYQQELGTAGRIPVPGVDVPLPGDVQQQKVEQATATTEANARIRNETRDATAAENTSLRFHDRMKDALDNIASLSEWEESLGLFGQTQAGFAPNPLQSAEGQKYRQAQRAFTEARLRQDSGAAIPENEFENDRQTYFVQPGDTAELIEQKRRSRQVAIRGLAEGAGIAYTRKYGPLDQQVPSAAPTPEAYTLPDGTVVTRQPDGTYR